jgi:hypothetical protein
MSYWDPSNEFIAVKQRTTLNLIASVDVNGPLGGEPRYWASLDVWERAHILRANYQLSTVGTPSQMLHDSY